MTTECKRLNLGMSRNVTECNGIQRPYLQNVTEYRSKNDGML